MTRNLCDKFRSALFLILCLLLIISLASCFPEFKNPIPPPPKLKADHQILGTWTRAYKVHQSVYKEQLSIFRRSSGWIDVVWIYNIDKKESEDGINLLVLEGYSTSVNKQRFLCLRVRKRDFNWAGQRNHSRSDKEVGERPFTKDWIMVNYEIPSKDELIIKHFSTQKVKELIKEGKLKGEVVKEEMFKEQGQSLDKVTVTSSSDELVEVISKEGAGAFIWQDTDDDLRDMYILVFKKQGK